MNRTLLATTRLGFAVLTAKVPNLIVSPRLQLKTVIKCCQLLHEIRGATNFSTPILVQENKSTAARGDLVKPARQLKISTILIHNARLVVGPRVSKQKSDVAALLSLFVNLEKFETIVNSTRNQATAVRELEAINQY